MVRMDECVEALYNKESMQNKKKTMSIIKVMKGAISVSKSRTGECIFRHNKLEKKKLERTVKKYKSDTNYILSRFDTKKKFVVSRWRNMLEKQTSCNSTRLFNEVLDVENTDQKPEPSDGSDDDSYFKKFLALRLQRQEFGANGKGLIHLKIDNTEHDKDASKTQETEATQDEVYVTEKNEIRRKYSLSYRPDEESVIKPETLKPQPARGRLPSLPNVSLLRRSQTVMPKAEENEKDQERPELTRDLTDWSDWRLNDKDWLLDYIKRQKTRHEDLIMRNALAKIEEEMSGVNTIRRHQVRARLHWRENIESQQNPKPLKPQKPEFMREEQTDLKRMPRKTIKNTSENFLSVKAESHEENIFTETPRRLQKEMTKVRMRSLPESLPIILENPTKKKQTSTCILPLITVTKA